MIYNLESVETSTKALRIVSCNEGSAVGDIDFSCLNFRTFSCSLSAKLLAPAHNYSLTYRCPFYRALEKAMQDAPPTRNESIVSILPLHFCPFDLKVFDQNRADIVRFEIPQCDGVSLLPMQLDFLQTASGGFGIRIESAYSDTSSKMPIWLCGPQNQEWQYEQDAKNHASRVALFGNLFETARSGQMLNPIFTTNDRSTISFHPAKTRIKAAHS